LSLKVTVLKKLQKGVACDFFEKVTKNQTLPRIIAAIAEPVAVDIFFGNK